MSDSTPYDKIKATCEDCLLDVFDTGCSGCVEKYRMAGACECTCKKMAPQLCPVIATADECNCDGGTTQVGGYVTGAWFGMSPASDGSTLADIAAITAPEDPRVFLSLYGSTEALTCVTEVSGASIPLGGETVQIDPVFTPVERADGACIGGMYMLSADDLGLTIAPVEGGTGTDCDQVGGFRTMIAVAADSRGRILMMCPFNGIVGTGGCLFTVSCCAWSETLRTVTSCDTDGGAVTIHIEMTLSGACDCPVDATLTIDGTDYPLTSSPTIIDHEVTGCFAGQDITISKTQTYGDGLCGFDCTSGTTTDHVFL